jgi:hypothetical protein
MIFFRGDAKLDTTHLGSKAPRSGGLGVDSNGIIRRNLTVGHATILREAWQLNNAGAGQTGW